MIDSTTQIEGKHYLVLFSLLAALGTQVMGMPNWSAAFTPMFIGGLLLQVGTTLAALFVGAPQKPYTLENDRRKGVGV